MSPPVSMFRLALCLAGAACAAEQRLFPGEEASFSPDGRRIAYQAPARDGFIRSRIRTCATGEEILLHPGCGHSVFPSWATDGSVVYTFGNDTDTAYAAHAKRSTAGFNLRLWKDGVSHPLTHGRQRDYTASFAPDGQTVYYSSTAPAARPSERRPGAFDNASTLLSCTREGDVRELLPLQGASSGLVSPRVSPDGRLLVWSHVSAFFSIWRLAAARLDALQDFCFLTPSR